MCSSTVSLNYSKSHNYKYTWVCEGAKISILHTSYIHAEKYVVLGTHAQILPYSAELTADILAKDVGCPRGGWEQPRQD